VSQLHEVATFAAANRTADPLTVALDYRLLVSLGWDQRTKIFAPNPDHRLFGYPVCRVAGCDLEAWDPSRMCTGCQQFFAASTENDIEVFCSEGASRKVRSRHRMCLVCRVPGFERPVSVCDLCLSCDGLRRRRHQSVREFVEGDGQYPAAAPRPSLGICAVASCQRLAGHPMTSLCDSHDVGWRSAARPDLVVFCQKTDPCIGDRNGRAALAGLDDNVIAELLYAVQVSFAEGRRVMPTTLRNVVSHLRRCGAGSVAEAIATTLDRTPVRWLLVFAADRAALARSDIETEQAGDVWDLRLWGSYGRLSFIGGGTSPRYRGREPSRPISQPWLKQAAKTWAGEALARTTAGPVRAAIGAVGLFSESLARRPDGGIDPSALSHRDVEAFLARLTRLERAGTISGEHRDRSINLVAKVLRDCREMGLGERGAVLGALPDDVVVRRSERPRTKRRDDEVGRALPTIVMAQLLSPEYLDRLEAFAGPTIRAAVELMAGVGRRTAELCSLRFGCLEYDEHSGGDGELRASPVLVHDMPKVRKVGCRLPIHEREAAIIAAQQERVRAAFPHVTAGTPLFPRPLKNPDGSKPIGTSHIQRLMRQWVSELPRLDGPEKDSAGRPVPFPRDRVFPYAFRHSFAQRHADAGTPVDTLKELLGHETVRTTLGYYRVTARRKRSAQDALGPLQVNADGRRVRPDTGGLLDTEALREQIGQVAVPFGICTEPSNVSADGRSCPFRHRCFGCTYFRTDPSYQPELRGYRARLLADRERLVTALPQLAEWARNDAVPAGEEIESLRRLILANEEALAGLDTGVRRGVEAAIGTVRSSRAALEATYPVEFRGLAGQARPTLYPTIERAADSERSHG
jgi:integrase